MLFQLKGIVSKGRLIFSMNMIGGEKSSAVIGELNAGESLRNYIYHDLNALIHVFGAYKSSRDILLDELQSNPRIKLCFKSLWG